MRALPTVLSLLVLAIALGVDAAPTGAATEELVVDPTKDCQSGGFSAEDGTRGPWWTLASLEAQLPAAMNTPISRSGASSPDGVGASSTCSMHQVCAWGCDFNNSCEDIGCHPALGARCLYDPNTGWGCCVIP